MQDAWLESRDEIKGQCWTHLRMLYHLKNTRNHRELPKRKKAVGRENVRKFDALCRTIEDEGIIDVMTEQNK